MKSNVCALYWQYLRPSFLFFNDTAPTEIYTLSLHDALPIWKFAPLTIFRDRYAIALDNDCILWRSEEHTSELQSRGLTSHAVFCLKKRRHRRNGRRRLSPTPRSRPPRYGGHH